MYTYVGGLGRLKGRRQYLPMGEGLGGVNHDKRFMPLSIHV